MTIVNTEDAVQAENAEPADTRPMQARIWDEAGEDAREYLRRVTAMIGLRGIDAHTLAQLTPQFDLLPYAEAVSRHCVLMRDENARLLLVLADPFDGNLRVWAEAASRRSIPSMWARGRRWWPTPASRSRWRRWRATSIR
ncbi:hypothetical protein [Cupriavidus pauculus]|uniref:hypothetical protein n=1 Tax=Cupriavidus pauculus TaxID=82633 RepID=UPI0038574C60